MEEVRNNSQDMGESTNDSTCDDHTTKKNISNVKAQRYCIKCNALICYECVFDFHTYEKHSKQDILTLEELDQRAINEMTKIEDKLKKMELETSALKRPNEDLAKFERDLAIANDKNSEMVTYLRSKIDLLEEEFNKLCKVAIADFKASYERSENNQTLREYFNIKEDLLESNLKGWRRLKSMERVVIYRNLHRTDLVLVGKLKDLDRKVTKASGIQKDNSLCLKMKNALDAISIFKEEFTNIISKFDDNLRKLRKIETLGASNDTTISNKNSSLFPQSSCQPLRQSHVNNSNIVANAHNSANVSQSDVQMTYSNPIIPSYDKEALFNANKNHLEYFISLKQGKKLGEVVFVRKYNIDRPVTLQIQETCFNEKLTVSQFPPEYSKYVNLGGSVLVTGGFDKIKSTNMDNCWVVMVSEVKKGFSVRIFEYPSMKYKRERHNLIYLENLNITVACGGFHIATAEQLKLSNCVAWEPLPNMLKSRGNSSMGIVNDSLVFCIGGFEIIGQKGNYLTSCEFINMNNTQAGWTLVDIESRFQLGAQLTLCAMGTINLSHDHLILVGGFDGKKFVDTNFEITFGPNGEVTSFEKVERKLNKGTIFFSNSRFILDDNKFYNFDYNSKLIMFDLSTNAYTTLTE